MRDTNARRRNFYGHRALCTLEYSRQQRGRTSVGRLHVDSGWCSAVPLFVLFPGKTIATIVEILYMYHNAYEYETVDTACGHLQYGV